MAAILNEDGALTADQRFGFHDSERLLGADRRAEHTWRQAGSG